MQYNTALCDFLSLPAAPGVQSYTDVTTQIYPLRAEPEKIKDFCDQYLNKSPYETFEPAGPWVIMQVVDYGRMRVYAHDWFAQHEVAFGIPLRCSKGKTFEEFGVVYPFIWVDNPLSMEGGRQIYGWPKAGMNIETTPPVFQPNLPRTLVSAKVTPFLRKKQDWMSLDTPFVEIRQTRPFLSGRSGIADTVTAVPRAVSSYFSVVSSVFQSMSDFAGLAAGYKLPDTGSPAADFTALSGQVQSLLNTFQKGFGYFNSMIPMLAGMVTGSQERSTNPTLTIYNMKQVRDADDPSKACYQAIVRSKMTVENVKDGGLLFDPLSGDSSGGIEISLSSKGNSYLDELVGMISGGAKSNDVLCVRPLVPYWEKVDVSYGLADRQTWRTKATDWLEEPQAAQSGTIGAPTQSSTTAVPKKPDVIDYIERGSGAALAASGKRQAKDAVLHVFMVEAKLDTLQELVDRYLNNLATQNVAKEFEFKVNPAFPWVYAILLSYDEMTIGGGKGQYGDDVLTFATLVNYTYWQINNNVREEKTELAFIPLYTFVGTDWSFVTEYEVYGRLTFKSTLDSPENAWIRQYAAGDAYKEVLSISTTLFPAAQNIEGAASDVGGEAKPVEIIAISAKPSTLQTPSTAANLSPSDTLEKYGLKEFMNMPASAVESARYSIALKQVRNAIDGQQADYQSLVGIRRSFTLAENNFRESSVKIRIYGNNTLPLVTNWGLQGEVRSSPTDGFKERAGKPSFTQFEANALSFTGTVNEEQGRELWRRINPAQSWTKA